MLSTGFSTGFLLGKNFFRGNVVLNPVLNLLVYRRDLSSLWRRLERLEAIELESSKKSMVYECAKILAEVSGLPRNKTYQRITPRTEEELRAVKDLSGGYPRVPSKISLPTTLTLNVSLNQEKIG